MPIININSDACVAYAAKLERISKSALPVAIRQTLNKTALRVKQVTMPEESSRVFKKRKPTFFGATSSVDFAKGLEIDDMKSTVGFIAPGTIKEAGHATQDLEEQEHGGDIDKRAFIASEKGRSMAGNVKADLLLTKIKDHIIDSSKELGKRDGERFIRAAMKAGYPGGFVIGTGKNQKGNKALLQILSIHRATVADAARTGVKAGNMIVKTKEIYSVKKGRKAHVKATNFMHKASAEAAKEMERIFCEQAEIAINKVK